MKKQTSKKAPSLPTRVLFILDKSGSMDSCRDATITGFNEYVHSLKKDKDGKYELSLTLFDTDVLQFMAPSELKDVVVLTKANYVPNGMTALLDAVFFTVQDAEHLPFKGKTLCVIMTDGGENSSKETTTAKLAAKIKELEKKGTWTFVFLGANQDSWATAQTFGLSAQNVSNFNATGKGMSAAFTVLASNTRSYSAQSVQNTSNFFSAADQDNLADNK